MLKKETTISKLLKWLDSHILLVFSGFLLAFIPLYPKLPLFEALPGYIVRVRLEDILILIAFIVYFIQVLRKKVTFKSPVSKLIFYYLAAGLLSILSAIFIIKTIPIELLHIGKSTLHFFRYIEYFALFFIVLSSIKNLKSVKTLITIFIITLMAIAFYGIGQKYFYWPLYSTMNREFSKGITLYLTEHARVQSTFGGHYDLAAYLVIVMPLTLALAYQAKNKKIKTLLHVTHILGLWLLIMTASRASFVAFGVASALVILFNALKKKTLKKKISWGLSRSLFLGTSVGLIMLFFGRDMYDRFLHVLEGYPVAHNIYHGANAKKKLAFSYVFGSLGLFGYQPPSNGVAISELDQVLTPSDTQPSTNRPSDVYVNVPDKIQVATISADGTSSLAWVDQERTWSDNALKYGLSIGIRLDTLWPNAIKGFLRNPLLGSGYATLNKEGFSHFLEADSTDNNYLRTLGETGLAGLILFYGIFVLLLKKSHQQIKSKNTFIAALNIGFFAATIGLLINATYIDVFAASKVAFTYWSLAGLITGLYLTANKSKK
jgi:hypothetical protein